VFCYDYSGYGLSDGKCSASNTLADIEAAYAHVCKKYPQLTRHIILYGQSLGSGPTIYLATQKQVSGVIIHSGLMSGLRVIRNVENTSWYDIYANVDRISGVHAPVFVIHGTEDQEIPIHHALGLSEAAPMPYKPWFVEGAGHNNIEVHWRDTYFEKLNDFVRNIERTEPPASSSSTEATAGGRLVTPPESPMSRGDFGVSSSIVTTTSTTSTASVVAASSRGSTSTLKMSRHSHSTNNHPPSSSSRISIGGSSNGTSDSSSYGSNLNNGISSHDSTNHDNGNS